MTDRLADATAMSERLHRGQVRKGTSIPYVSHLYAVAAILMEWGADEELVVAGLLHDAVEDCGGMPVAEEIRQRFGDRVTDIVLACSDSVTTDAQKKADWRERKQAHIDEIAHMSRDAALVTAADKLHNLRAINRDIRHHGRETLQRFREPDSLHWYYSSVLEKLEGLITREAHDELSSEFAGLIKKSSAS